MYQRQFKQLSTIIYRYCIKIYPSSDNSILNFVSEVLEQIVIKAKLKLEVLNSTKKQLYQQRDMIDQRSTVYFRKFTNFMKKTSKQIQKSKKASNIKKEFEKIVQNKESLEGEQFLISREKIKTKKKQSMMKNLIQNLYSKHYPLASSKYQVRQQWQNKNFQFQQHIYDELIQLETILAEIYTIIILVCYIGIIWYVSSYRMLEIITNNEAPMILMGAIFVVLMDGGVKFYFKYIFHEEQMRHLNVLMYFKIEIYMLFYFFLNILLIENRSTEKATQFWYLLDFITTILSYNRTNHLWHYLKIITSTTSFKTKFKFIDLFGTLVLLAHIFALLLYLSSYYDPSNSWTLKVTDRPLTSIDVYFYSVYFAITTMLTIGYGDLTPSNKVQTLAVLVVQIVGNSTVIVGVAAFSYIINEVGFTMSVLRKQEEHIEQSLSTLLKMSKFYRLEKDLTDFAKAHLISNRKSIEMIYPEDEVRVLSQLNDDLRQTIIFQNGLSVVKSCIFFLCHWTKYFQVEISKRLIKKILHPNESLIQLPGKQKIYIIKSGKLEIYTNRNSNYKQHFKKLLKTISPDPNKQISNNIYGYTSIISSRPVKLSAISKDFTCTFMISKEHFLSCVHQNKLDQEYYYQIKARIEECRCVEGWQTPAVLNIRQHYSPSEILIIKREQLQCEQKKNKRRFRVRFERICCRTLLSKNPNDEMKESVQKKTLPFIQTISLNNLKQLQPQLLDKNECLLYQFENVKQYYNYFKKSNISNVLSNLERKNFIRFTKDNRASFVPYCGPETAKFQDSILSI